MDYLIMLDFDGTVLDTMRMHGELAAKVMQKHFRIEREQARKQYFATTGIPFPRQLEKIFPGASPAEREACAREYADRKTNEVFNAALPFPEIKRFFSDVQKRGVHIIISSSTEKEMIDRLLKKFGLARFVSHVFGNREGTKSQHIEKMNQLYKPKTILFIGDSPSDVGLSRLHSNVVSVGRSGPLKSGMLSPRVLTSLGGNLATDNLTTLLRFYGFSQFRGKGRTLTVPRQRHGPRFGSNRPNRKKYLVRPSSRRKK